MQIIVKSHVELNLATSTGNLVGLPMARFAPERFLGIKDGLNELALNGGELAARNNDEFAARNSEDEARRLEYRGSGLVLVATSFSS